MIILLFFLIPPIILFLYLLFCFLFKDLLPDLEINTLNPDNPDNPDKTDKTDNPDKTDNDQEARYITLYPFKINFSFLKSGRTSNIGYLMKLPPLLPSKPNSYLTIHNTLRHKVWDTQGSIHSWNNPDSIPESSIDYSNINMREDMTEIRLPNNPFVVYCLGLKTDLVMANAMKATIDPAYKRLIKEELDSLRNRMEDGRITD